MGERKLLCEVIRVSVYQATSGDSGAIHFFSSTTFNQMAMLLGLNAEEIRKGVLAKVAAKTKQCRQTVIIVSRITQ
jgi:hypothetical protein